MGCLVSINTKRSKISLVQAWIFEYRDVNSNDVIIASIN
jgi:hypothetical protein